VNFAANFIYLLSLNTLNYAFIKQKINYPYIQNTLIVIPALADIVSHYNFREGIAGKKKRLIF